MKYVPVHTLGALLLIGFMLALLAGCKGNVACQSPPPAVRLIVVTPAGKPVITPDNAAQITVQYTRNGYLTPVSDVQISPATGLVESYELIGVARQATDTTHIYLSAGNKPLGIIQLKTYVDNSRCDGWTHISELRFNGQVVPYDNLKTGYVLTVP